MFGRSAMSKGQKYLFLLHFIHILIHTRKLHCKFQEKYFTCTDKEAKLKVYGMYTVNDWMTLLNMGCIIKSYQEYCM